MRDAPIRTARGTPVPHLGRSGTRAVLVGASLIEVDGYRRRSHRIGRDCVVVSIVFDVTSLSRSPGAGWREVLHDRADRHLISRSSSELGTMSPTSFAESVHADADLLSDTVLRRHRQAAVVVVDDEVRNSSLRRVVPLVGARHFTVRPVPLRRSDVGAPLVGQRVWAIDSHRSLLPSRRMSSPTVGELRGLVLAAPLRFWRRNSQRLGSAFF